MYPRTFLTGSAAFAFLLHSLAFQTEAAIPTSYPTGSGPAKVAYGPDGKLVYTYESNGDTIPDFSNAGYKGGGVPIPDVPVVTTLSPISGDNTPQIQAAIDNLAAQPLGSDGFRGCIKLNAGIWNVSGTMNITASGIVVRGAGDGTNGTTIRTTTGNLIMTINGGGSRALSSQTWNMTASYVPVGATWFALDTTSGLAVGDEIYVCFNCNDTFKTLVGHPTMPDMCWEAVITEIDGNRVRIDRPIMEAIEQQYGGGYVKKFSWPDRLQNSGFEDFRADSPGVSVDANGNTGGTFADISDCKNCWLRRVTNDKLRGHTTQVLNSVWITIQDLVSFHNPLPGGHSGASTSINSSDKSQGILWFATQSSDGGFEFTASAYNVGPIVFCESGVPHGFAFSGPHKMWNIGYLYDCLDMHHGLVVDKNGTGGWSSGNQLAWNCETTSGYNFERAPTVHEWIHGCIGPNQPSPPDDGGGAAEIVSYGTHLQPASLYRAQLADRLGLQAMINTLGGPDGSNRYILSSSTTSSTVTAGSSTTYPVTMTTGPLFGGNTVTFSASGLPSGASVSFSPAARTSSGTTTATVTTSTSTPAGTYNVKIVGTGTFTATSGQTITLANPLYVTLTVNASSGGGTLKYEAESLTIDSSSQSVTTLSDANCSGGSFRQLNGVAVGDFVKFLVPNVPAGNYNLVIGMKKNSNRAMVQTKNGKVGGTYGNFGSVFDEYSSAVSYTEVNLGLWAVSASDKFVGFHVTGKNNSSSGFVVAIDYIKLVPQ